jgi:hypothetical protein
MGDSAGILAATVSGPVFGTTAYCALCVEQTDVLPTGDGLRLLISRDGQEATQEVFVHVRCLRSRLHPRLPFEPSAFGEDWNDLPQSRR